MTAQFVRGLIGSGCLYLCVAVVGAGEILILQPAPGDSQNRSARESERAMDSARQRVGKQGAGMTTIIVGDDPAQKRDFDRSKEAAQEASRDAREYLKPVPGDGVAEGGTTIILRSAPIKDTERLQQRARSYVVPNTTPAAAGRKDCGGNVSSQIGMIGEGAGSARGNVHERGTSSVDAQGQCR